MNPTPHRRPLPRAANLRRDGPTATPRRHPRRLPCGLDPVRPPCGAPHWRSRPAIDRLWTHRRHERAASARSPSRRRCRNGRHPEGDAPRPRRSRPRRRGCRDLDQHLDGDRRTLRRDRCNALRLGRLQRRSRDRNRLRHGARRSTARTRRRLPHLHHYHLAYQARLARIACCSGALRARTLPHQRCNNRRT